MGLWNFFTNVMHRANTLQIMNHYTKNMFSKAYLSDNYELALHQLSKERDIKSNLPSPYLFGMFTLAVLTNQMLIQRKDKDSLKKSIYYLYVTEGLRVMDMDSSKNSNIVRGTLTMEDISLIEFCDEIQKKDYEILFKE